MPFAKTRRRIPKPRSVQLFGEPIQWVDDVRYLGMTLDKRLSWSNIDLVRKKAVQRLGALGPLLNRRSGLSTRNGVPLYKQRIRPMMDYACPVLRSAAPISRNCGCCSPSVFELLPMHLGTLATGKFTMISVSPTSPTISKSNGEIRLEVRWFGEHLSWAAWQTSTLTERRPRSHKTGKSGSTTCPGYSHGGHADTLSRANWHFSATLNEIFPRLFLSCKANARVRGWIQNFPDWRCKNHKTYYKSYRPPSPSK